MSDALLADLRALAEVFAFEERVWHRTNPTSYEEGRRDSYEVAESMARGLIAKHTPEPE